MKNLQKAKIINLDNNNETFTCQFNPDEYSVTKQSSVKQAGGKGQDVPQAEHSGGQPSVLKIKLFFDTTATGEDVRTKYTNKLLDLMNVKNKNKDKSGEGQKPSTGQPARVQFMWGGVPSFTAFISNINQKFTMFLNTGVPVRATLDITFKEIKDDAASKGPQNPTTYSEPRKTRKVGLGDRIDMIAFEEYGKADYWYELAIANELDDPLNIAPGHILSIPSLTSKR